MAAALITYGILLLIYFVLSRFDGVSSWMDDAEFDEPSDDAPELDDSEYDWGQNVKGYKSEEE